MNEEFKRILESTLKSIKSNPYKWGFWVGVILIIIPILTWILYFIGDCGYVLIGTSLTVGDALVFYGTLLAFLGTVALGALALWQNQQIHNQHIETLEPMLSMKLISLNGLLYLAIENTGATEAKEIKVTVNSIENNGDNTELNLDQLFESIFELYPNETVQGCVGFSGANISTRIFPQLNANISYVRPDINRRRTYNRTVIFDNGYAQKIVADIGIDNSKIEGDVESVAYSVVRIANYLEGRTLFKSDKLNVMPSSSLAADFLQAIQAKENKIETTQKDLDTTKPEEVTPQ